MSIRFTSPGPLIAATASVILGAVWALVAPLPSQAQSGGGYNLAWNTIDSGGGTRSSGGYSLTTTFGQFDAGPRFDAGYRLSGGFLFANVAPPLAGDCNFDNAVDAGDIPALVIEVFDGDSTAAAATAGGTYPGSTGCDANVDGWVDAGDLACLVRLIMVGQGSCAH